MTEAELAFENETRKHQQEVARLLIDMASRLLERAATHDASKLTDPERAVFIEWTPKLKAMTYGSDEYKSALKEMGVALQHHYAVNPHHPEFNDLNGHTIGGDSIAGMHLVDIVEMLCDWKAATLRHADGDMGRSIDVNQNRFDIDGQLTHILRNTSGLLDQPLCPAR